MSANINIHQVCAIMNEYIKKGALDQRVLEVLQTHDGFIPKECDLWDYKTTTSDDAISLAKTVLYITSFYNAYGGYIIYGVAEGDTKEAYQGQGIKNGCFNEQQMKALVKEYTGETIDFSYREVPFKCGEKELIFGLLHIPKRSREVPPIFFVKDGPEIRPRANLFKKDEAYVRLQDNCVLSRDKRSLQFLFGPSEEQFDRTEDHLRLLAAREIILDHNLPDRNVICSRFFGREDIIERLWRWLSDDFSKIRVLAGDGGKGKTSIAYEFSEEVCRARPYDLSRLFWVTAKSRQFSGLENVYVQTPKTHFQDLQSLLNTLCSEYGLLEAEIEYVSIRSLKKESAKRN